MQRLVAWLVARPQNAVLVLATTLLTPMLQVLSGIVMVLLVLKHGIRLAVIEAVIAAALLLVIALIVGAPLAQIMESVLTTWLPAVLLAAVILVTQSLTLTLQVSALVAVLLTLGFHLVVDDVVAYWQPVTTYWLEWARENGLHEQAQLMQSDPVMTANMVTIAIVLSSWMLYVLYLLFGYRVYAQMSEDTGIFGRFCDLNFGRVLALILAVTSLLAVASEIAPVQNIAFVMFAIFWIQGLAIVHWLHAEAELPLFVVIATYMLMLMPMLNVFLILALAISGYVDAWFGFRSRSVKQQKS